MVLSWKSGIAEKLHWLEMIASANESVFPEASTAIFVKLIGSAGNMIGIEANKSTRRRVFAEKERLLVNLVGLEVFAPKPNLPSVLFAICWLFLIILSVELELGVG